MLLKPDDALSVSIMRIEKYVLKVDERKITAK